MFGKSLLGLSVSLALCQAPAMAQMPEGLKLVVVRAADAAEYAAFDGVVEAVRQTVLSAQVSGAVMALPVKAGDVVREGQLLARIDGRAAEQTSAASEAQLLAARSALELATKDYQRQQQLHQKQFISPAALERAEAQFQATSAQLKSRIAQAGVARVQSDFFVIRAPFAGVVADVSVTQGDMAMPGKALLTLYDPAALRITASIPQSALSRIAAGQAVRIELPGLPADRRWLVRPQVQVLPTVDAGTHAAQVRVDLPAGLANVVPGMFARIWLPGADSGDARLRVPTASVVRRAEMAGVYVIAGNGRPVLRQVRLGRARDDGVEVLSGLSPGERVALDPQAAARVR